ncbi:hypothetical protein FBQ90_02470 [Betaproteobacteria bacterium PRO5]|nr:hypothetical protein [Betaproteobacteria bacterium PRO5]
MPNPTEVISHWIDMQPEGALIRTLDLEHLVDRHQASRARVNRRARTEAAVLRWFMTDFPCKNLFTIF